MNIAKVDESIEFIIELLTSWFNLHPSREEFPSGKFRGIRRKCIRKDVLKLLISEGVLSQPKRRK